MKRSVFIDLINKRGITVNQLTKRWGLTKNEVNKITNTPIIHALFADAIKGFALSGDISSLLKDINVTIDAFDLTQKSEKDAKIDIARSIALASPRNEDSIVCVVACMHKKGILGYNTVVINKADNPNYSDIRTECYGEMCRGVVIYRCYLAPVDGTQKKSSRTTHGITDYPINRLLEHHML